MLPKMMIAMTNEQFQREKNYYASVYLVDKMLEKELLSKKEYHKVCKILSEKFKPILGGVIPSRP